MRTGKGHPRWLERGEVVARRDDGGEEGKDEDACQADGGDEDDAARAGVVDEEVRGVACAELGLVAWWCGVCGVGGLLREESGVGGVFPLTPLKLKGTGLLGAGGLLTAPFLAMKGFFAGGGGV